MMKMTLIKQHITMTTACLLTTGQGIPQQTFVFSVIIEFITSFFQMVSLVSFNQGSRANETMSNIVEFFNLEIVVDLADDICPSPRVKTVLKYFIKNVFSIIVMLLSILIIICIYKLALKVYRLYIYMKSNPESIDDHENTENTEIKLIDKFLIGFVKVLMFGYKNISVFTIVILHCTCLLYTSPSPRDS